MSFTSSLEGTYQLHSGILELANRHLEYHSSWVLVWTYKKN